MTYGTIDQAITCTLASLADGASRECTAIDNQSTLLTEVWLDFQVKVGTVANLKIVKLWFYASQNGTDYTSNATGADAGVTMLTVPNFEGPLIIQTPSNATAYRRIIPVSAFFNGTIPPKWGIVVTNNSGAALDSTESNHKKLYRGVT